MKAARNQQGIGKKMARNETIAFDESLPLWWRLLNIEDTEFEKSKYAALAPGGNGKFRLKDLNILRRIAPNLYEAAADEVRENNAVMLEHKGMLKKYTLGRKLGSIPVIDMALNPELQNDPKAQDKYFRDHPELKVK